MTDPQHIAEAYLHVATVNHYLVVVAPVYTRVTSSTRPSRS